MRSSDRLIYQKIEIESDLNELWENCFQGNTNMEYINRYSPYKLHHKKDLENFLIRNPNLTAWRINRIEENDIIGYILLAQNPVPLEFIVGYVIGQLYAKNGYATEALIALNNYTDSLNISCLKAYCLNTNKASIRVLEKCGFVMDREQIRQKSNTNDEVSFKRVKT